MRLMRVEHDRGPEDVHGDDEDVLAQAAAALSCMLDAMREL
jgi:hypothetical protein